MTEEELEYNDGEYNEAGEEQEYYDEEEGEGEGEWDGNEEDAVQVGDEIQLVSSSKHSIAFSEHQCH